jgi:tryptophanyl-tRNA synthetase
MSATITRVVRRLSGFAPTGLLQLGHHLGVIRPALEAAGTVDSVTMIADLHAMTVERDPHRLRQLTDELLATLLATGVDPASSVVYAQSDVPEHAELHYLLDCVCGYGEVGRTTAVRPATTGPEPALMAADILLHDTDEVPAGRDQSQGLELARDVANRFNTRYGRTFVVPRTVPAGLAARDLDLTDPTGKLDRSARPGAGLIFLLDGPDVVRRKVNLAVTDTDSTVLYDPCRKPGVSNLLEILAACERDQPDIAALRFTTYAELKEAVTDTIVDTLRPIQHGYAQLMADRGYLADVRRDGAERARDRAATTLQRARAAIGLPPT